MGSWDEGGDVVVEEGGRVEEGGDGGEIGRPAEAPTEEGEDAVHVRGWVEPRCVLERLTEDRLFVVALL